VPHQENVVLIRPCLRPNPGHRIRRLGRAQLDAKNKLGAKADEKLRLMKAEGDYEVAKEKCEDRQGAAIATCKKDASAAYDKAKTMAKQATAADAKTKS
jgi:hypothetical protein